DNHGRNENAIDSGNSVIGHAPLPVCSHSRRRAFAVAVVTSSFLPEKSRHGRIKMIGRLSAAQSCSGQFASGGALSYRQRRRADTHKLFSKLREADSRSRL